MQTTSISAIQAAIPTARASTPTLPKHVPVTSEKQYKDFLSNMHFTLKSNFERSGHLFHEASCAHIEVVVGSDQGIGNVVVGDHQ